jgi:hypothetical protein
MSVDLQRNRIALTMKTQAGSDSRPRSGDRGPKAPRSNGAGPKVDSAKPFSMPKSGTVAPNGMRFK